MANTINPVTYQGIRGGALLKFNEDWTALRVQSYPMMDAQGVFYETPSGRYSLLPLQQQRSR